MRVVRCSTKDQLAYDAAVAGAERIREALHRHGRATVVLAAGMSQASMLDYLVREKLDWSGVTAFHMDEYVGIKAGHPGSFRTFLKERFLDRVHLNAFHPIVGEGNPVSECKRLNKLIGGLQVDVAFVGIGENGHLAFNDPPADFRNDSPYLLVKLDRACRRQQVKEGWFGTVDQVPAKAISMSVQQILSAGSIICSVPDKRKAKAVKASLEGPVTPKMPASILQQHPQTSVFLEPESAALLGATHRPLIHQVLQLPQIPEPLAPGLKRFHLFAAAADWKKVPERDLARFAQRALASGAATVTAWGPGSFAVKLALEGESVRRNVAGGEGRQVPAVCYKAEEVDDALYYFLEDVKETVRTCNAWVAVVVGSPAHRERLLEALGDPAAFIDRHINADDE
ncbi:MAG: glucosamine-6-phosphate deaminase [Planctomycetes bacterium]|nr:glucosamine-6-phosphate deaminase [Planctomycetota bacterium]